MVTTVDPSPFLPPLCSSTSTGDPIASQHLPGLLTPALYSHRNVGVKFGKGAEQCLNLLMGNII